MWCPTGVFCWPQVFTLYPHVIRQIIRQHSVLYHIFSISDPESNWQIVYVSRTSALFLNTRWDCYYQHWLNFHLREIWCCQLVFLLFGDFSRSNSSKTCEKKILPLVSVHGGSPSFSDFSSFLHPSLVSVLLCANDLCPILSYAILSYDVVLRHNMVRDRGFMDWWQRLFSAGSCDHRFAHLFHFSFVFVKMGTKFAVRFINVKITAHTWEAIQSVRGVVVISLVFWVDRKTTKSIIRFA